MTIAVNFAKAEEERLIIQQALDGNKASVERNRLGQFATPPALASAIVDTTLAYLDQEEDIRFLDPGFGTGSFYSALLRTQGYSRLATAMGVEIDEEVAAEAKHLWLSTPLDLRVGDFTLLQAPAPGARPNLLISNPPYVRHHHLTAAAKTRLGQCAERESGIRPSGLSGLYVYFLLIAHGWLAPDGLGCWLIPSEFLTVNYGVELRRYLVEKVELLRVHTFDATSSQFNDALVSSTVLWFRKRPVSAISKVLFTYGSTLDRPERAVSVPVSTLNPRHKWSAIKEETPSLSQPHMETVRFGDLFKVKRGVATGANEFFILDEPRAQLYDIPTSLLTPILPSPRRLPDNVIDTDARGLPLLPQRLYMLSCNLSMTAIQAQYPGLWRYLQDGMAQGIHTRYLCRNRQPWYKQESRLPAPLLATYMGRQIASRDARPFRFILNHSTAIAANVYLMLYPTPLLQNELAQRPDLIRRIWSHMNLLDGNHLALNGRSYGGSLYKMEPGELEELQLAIPGLLHSRPIQSTLF